MPTSVLGTTVRRLEDPDLLTGRARFVADLPATGALEAVFVRSPHPHADVLGVDATVARARAGVVAVLTAADLGLGPVPPLVMVHDGCPRTPLATDRVRFVGDPVALVVAVSREAAADAADDVVVDYAPRPAVVDPEAALEDDAPLQFDSVAGNLVAGARDPDDVRPLEAADVVVRARIVNQRIAVVPMEADAALAVPAGVDGAGQPPTCGAPRLTLWVSTQMPHGLAARLGPLLGLGDGELRVVAPAVGGGFGGKPGLIPEHAAVAAAALRLGRPVRWIETRSENLVAMAHGRGQVQYGELGVDRDGRIVSLALRIVADAGAYGGFNAALAMGSTRAMAQGVYRVPAIRVDVAAALTNTTPVGAVRGAGRPEAAALLERLVDLAAAELQMDPAEFRRRNLLQPSDFPFTTKTNARYDSGDYPRALSEALRRADYEALRAEQARRRARGTRFELGIGLACYVEVTAGGGGEFAAVEVEEDGSVVVRAGTSAHGQGHETAFAMLVAEELGVDLAAVRLVQSDTARVPRGGGTGGSRSLQLAGPAVQAAGRKVAAQARRLAAELLEAAEDDIALGPAGAAVRGVPARAVPWGRLVAEAARTGQPLAGEVDSHQAGATYPFGAHVAVVEVDVETGKVRPVRHVAVDDCGRVLNPLLVTGQQHGGIAHGIGQALYEAVVYDDDGSPRTATLIDYGLASAADLCGFETSTTETPTPLNPLGAKGIGEAATVGSTPAVQNAVVDALAPFGVRHIDMPCTPERVWRAIEAARAARPALWRDPPAVFGRLPLRVAPTREVEAEI